MNGESIPLRVMVVADNPLARVGLVSLLQDVETCTVVGQAAYEEGMAATVDVYHPDVILCDLAWESALDAEGLAELVEISLPLVILINDVEQARDLWQLGVTGIMLQNADVGRIVAALVAVGHGLVIMDQDIKEIIGATNELAVDTLTEPLTERETDVLNLLAEGLSNKAIAFQLGISDHTVKFHVTAIMSKLAAQSRTEAVVKATRLGLIHL
jgi:DNA-binding NarL/FixJ family response regulator